MHYKMVIATKKSIHKYVFILILCCRSLVDPGKGVAKLWKYFIFATFFPHICVDNLSSNLSSVARLILLWSFDRYTQSHHALSLAQQLSITRIFTLPYTNHFIPHYFYTYDYFFSTYLFYHCLLPLYLHLNLHITFIVIIIHMFKWEMNLCIGYFHEFHTMKTS